MQIGILQHSSTRRTRPHTARYQGSLQPPLARLKEKQQQMALAVIIISIVSRCHGKAVTTRRTRGTARMMCSLNLGALPSQIACRSSTSLRTTQSPHSMLSISGHLRGSKWRSKHNGGSHHIKPAIVGGPTSAATSSQATKAPLLPLAHGCQHPKSQAAFKGSSLSRHRLHPHARSKNHIVTRSEQGPHNAHTFPSQSPCQDIPVLTSPPSHLSWLAAPLECRRTQGKAPPCILKLQCRTPSHTRQQS